MSSRATYDKIKRYTDDQIVLLLAKKWMSKNRFFKLIYKWFGIKVNRKFDINITERYNKYGNLETIFNLSTGNIFRKEFVIRLV